jgi:hypothetical protein
VNILAYVQQILRRKNQYIKSKFSQEKINNTKNDDDDDDVL